MGIVELLGAEVTQRALVAGGLVAVAAAIMGTFVVLRGMSLLGDSLAHASFGGIALGLLVGIAPFYFALLVAVLAGLAIHVMEHRGIARGDTAIGLIFAGGLGIGVILATVAGGFDEALLEAFFGNVGDLTWSDVALLATLVAVLLLLIGGLFKELVYLTFDQETAEAAGLPVHGLNLLFVVLAAVAVVSVIRVVGVLLASALLVVPAAASQQLGRSFRGTLFLSVLLALLSVGAGVLAAFALGWPPGGAVVVVSLGLFALLVAVRWVADRGG